MQIGVVFPQTEIGNDPEAIREYARRVEALGYRHLMVYDHVLGADTSNRPDWRGAYTSESPFHEVFVLLAHLAAITERLELVTAVLVLRDGRYEPLAADDHGHFRSTAIPDLVLDPLALFADLDD